MFALFIFAVKFKTSDHVSEPLRHGDSEEAGAPLIVDPDAPATDSQAVSESAWLFRPGVFSVVEAEEGKNCEAGRR